MIRVGVAGWDYPDWEGVVYPARSGARFDRLAFLSRYVETIEINTTFYRPAAPRTAESWVRRTEGRPLFRFCAKTHRALTHEPEGDLDAAARDTLAGLRPILEAGRLGALLVQFPQSFRRTAAAWQHLERVLERLSGWPVVVELRHRSWEAEATAERLEQLASGIVVVDQPQLGRSTARVLPRVTGAVGYLRLHGRNARNWFRAEAGRDARYDYLYSLAELEPLVRTARVMALAARELYVVQNNHFRGQALVNALQLRHLLEAEPPAAPEDLTRAYPQLEPLVRVERTRLL
ncbi:MAG TPA: DUF72 domain-containing protein [Candidatus Polarisedimenticolaceae bacterium]|nr:DUF72 domain-containing protein [Candidatus Polarisedimenticolaceae bacterium]